MNIEKLKETRIVSKGGHFLPIVFADINISAAFIAVGAIKVGKNLKNNNMNYSPIPQLIPYRKIKLNIEEKEHLMNSINDILL